MAGRGKLILLATKKPPSWDQWNERKYAEKTINPRIAMTQTEALSIFQGVIEAEFPEDACNLLVSRTPSRKHLSYWLGQIGRRQDIRLGNGRNFGRYAAAVVGRLRSREQDNMTLSESEEEKNEKEG